jgi:hypothetical protein
VTAERLEEPTAISRRINWEGLAHGGFVVAYLMLFVQQATQPYTIDEAAFPYAAAGILQGGVPEFYNGETRPHDMGLWHPPLYVYSLAVDMLVLGQSHLSVRAYGALAVICAWVVGLSLLRRIYPSGGAFSRVVFSGIFLLNPLIVAGSLVPDIDGTIGIVLIMAFLWVGTRIIQRRPTIQLLVLSCTVWFVSFFTKFTTTFLMVPVIVLAVILADSNRLRHAAVQASAFLTGGLAFLVTWFVTAAFLNANFRGPFDYFLQGVSQPRGGTRTGVLARIASTLINDPYITTWLGIPLVLFAMASALLVFGRPTERQERQLAAFLALTAAGIVVAYAAITGSVFTFPKYWGAAIPPLALLTAMGAQHLGGHLNASAAHARSPRGYLSWGILAFVTIASTAWAYIVVDNALAVGTWDAGRQLGVALKVTVLIALPVLILMSLGTIRGTGDRPRVAAIVLQCLGLGALAAVMLIPLAHDLVLRSAKYSTRYYVGERGLAEAVAYVRANLAFDAPIIAAKDIGLQSERPFYEDSLLFYGLTPGQFSGFLRETPIAAVVTRNKYDYSAAVFPEHFAVIAQYFTPVNDQPAPDLRIWVPKAEDARPTGDSVEDAGGIPGESQ